MVQVLPEGVGGAGHRRGDRVGRGEPGAAENWRSLMEAAREGDS